MFAKPRVKMLALRLTEEEYRLIKLAASAEGARGVSEYVRGLVLSAQKASQTANLKLARKPSGLGSVEERLLSEETNIEQMMIVLQKLQC